MRSLRFLVALVMLVACDRAAFVETDAGPRPTGVQPPDRPSTADEVDGPPVVAVLRDLSLGGDGVRGWDLDGRCTIGPDVTMPEDFECSPANELGAHVLDLPGCRDDAYGTEVAGAFQPLGSALEVAIEESAARGVSGYLLRVSQWSGDPDDPEVQVELAPISFAVPMGGVRGDALAWDGLDTFNTFAEDVGPDGRAIVSADDAFMSRGRLVARFEGAPAFVFRATDASVSVRLTDALLTAEFSGDSLADAVLSGRWAVEDIIGELDAVGLCDGAPLRAAAEIRIRDSPDVRAQPRGGLGTSSPCEALSVSFGFVAYPALWGDVLEPETALPAACPAAP